MKKLETPWSSENLPELELPQEFHLFDIKKL
jgi:hypothetical protein